MANVLVTGGTGSLGSVLVPRLVCARTRSCTPPRAHSDDRRDEREPAPHNRQGSDPVSGATDRDGPRHARWPSPLPRPCGGPDHVGAVAPVASVLVIVVS